MKQRLIMMIESYTNREIISTKLLLKHDPRNKTNFHEYIDDQENFILVALTINDKMIGGFSSGALSKKTICYQPSFLFSIGS